MCKHICIKYDENKINQNQKVKFQIKEKVLVDAGWVGGASDSNANLEGARWRCPALIYPRVSLGTFVA